MIAVNDGVSSLHHSPAVPSAHRSGKQQPLLPLTEIHFGVIEDIQTRGEGGAAYASGLEFSLFNLISLLLHDLAQLTHVEFTFVWKFVEAKIYDANDFLFSTC